MTFALHGQAVSQGIAIGHAHLVSHDTLEVPQYLVTQRQVEAEIKRFDAAVSEVQAELQQIKQESLADGAPGEVCAIIDLHSMVLADPMLIDETREIVRTRRCNAEWGMVQQMDALVEQFEQIEDAYLRERKADVVQVVERVVKVLMGRTTRIAARKRTDSDTIVVAHDLSPADTIQFKGRHIAAFVTDLGGATSHTAIVARSLAIPAVVGLHHVRNLVRDDDLVIVDGGRGIIIVDPDERVLDEYRLRRSSLELERNKLKRLVSTPAATLDGENVSLEANIELPEDVHSAAEMGANGIGLFRTEFLFMNRDTWPSEDEQFEAYRSVAQAMRGRPVTIRSLDIGADKTLRGVQRLEPNPALGLRAIRFCLAEPHMFLAQLRAILRAAHYGDVRLLLPMLAHVHEIEQSMVLLQRAKDQLRAAKQPFPERIKVGGMIEIPAAALVMGPLLKRLNFVSVGTNDLIQYTLAIDRTDAAVASMYDPLHPAVLQLIARIVQSAKRVGVPVSICGEMAGEAQYTRLLLGLGLRHLSMHPGQLLEVKQEVLRCDVSEAATRVQRLLRLDHPERVREQVERINAS
ncbi:MAG: phosphoenolpyruvate--protein phosphotransferase [Rhodocyclaceae bacterium]|nr:phosphoenolpyruvate--protein phosphotransferase [Rhodocyclaceae bacterium]MBX3670811.1 phosphoenolpyruvate--protein phosphotransferase [Rhodocyclaceae bacterium]